MEIPLSQPDIGQAEIEAVVEVVRSGRLSLGPMADRFERMFAAYCGTAEAVAVASGTAALHLCLRAVGIEPGAEVITTPFSFVASANVMLYEQARPVFVDIDPQTWNIDVSRIEPAITPRTRAILPVHVFGQTCPMEQICAIAERHGLVVIEDACEALGGRYRGRAAGSWGKMAAFGFYPNKQITTGEGGMVTTSDRQLAGLVRSMRNQGRDEPGQWLIHKRLGYNYRITEMSCALGVTQMRRVGRLLAQRARVAELYRQHLSEERRLSMQRIGPDVEMSWFVMVVRLDDGYSRQQRDRIITALRGRGIGCGNYFWPIHLQPFYMERFGYRAGMLPVCEAVAERTIALPFHARMTEQQVETVCRQLRSLL
ncbi:MAG: DegT/DnrJ/EryC1/StrS family aminotransferase [Phycisphaerae bacterium]